MEFDRGKLNRFVVKWGIQERKELGKINSFSVTL
jgi:hypothetical protein